jgi:hypothetical protein
MVITLYELLHARVVFQHAMYDFKTNPTNSDWILTSGYTTYFNTHAYDFDTLSVIFTPMHWNLTPVLNYFITMRVKSMHVEPARCVVL